MTIPFGSDDPETQKHAMNQIAQSEGPQPEIVCGCGRKCKISLMFRCLYCYVWFCKWCAEAHFGETREDYRARKRAEAMIGEG